MTTIRIPPAVLGDMLAWPLLARYGIAAPFRLQALANGDVIASDEPERRPAGTAGERAP